jgi:hypothetical protein
MTKPIINVADAPVYTGQSGEHFEFRMAMLARSAGGRSIGTGVLRVGAETYSVKPQDCIVNLPGGPQTAHQLVNTGNQDLVYLAISTTLFPEVAGYPESGKTGVRLGMGEAPDVRFLLRDGDKDTVGYWDGEDGSGVAAVVTREEGRSDGEKKQ